MIGPSAACASPAVSKKSPMNSRIMHMTAPDENISAAAKAIRTLGPFGVRGLGGISAHLHPAAHFTSRSPRNALVEESELRGGFSVPDASVGRSGASLLRSPLVRAVKRRRPRASWPRDRQ
eukprot:6274319-Prymnesium_polylepis.1